MIIQATPYGTAAEEPFAFTYSGDFTDSRVDGIGDVTLNTSGTFEVTNGEATVTAEIVGGGGGAMVRTVSTNIYYVSAGGGGGGIQTVEVTLTQGTYEIIVGVGGNGFTKKVANASAGTGGSTSAFGKTSTGGTGANTGEASYGTAGSGGTPNGQSGTAYSMQSAIGAPGGSPNGGSAVSATSDAANAGGNGWVKLTFGG